MKFYAGHATAILLEVINIVQRGDQLGCRADLDVIKSKPEAKELYLHTKFYLYCEQYFEFHPIMRVGDSE